MRTYTKLIISALAGTAALGCALPAQAQNYPQGHNRYEDRDDRRWDDRHDRYDDRWDDRRHADRGQVHAISSQIAQLERRVERLDGRDRISEREAAGLRRAVYSLRQQFRDYARNGLSQREMQFLQSRIHQLRDRLQHDRRDRDGRRW
jgi:predicted RNase H-like nuclease (RuvC/YqgF family)